MLQIKPGTKQQILMSRNTMRYFQVTANTGTEVRDDQTTLVVNPLACASAAAAPDPVKTDKRTRLAEKERERERVGSMCQKASNNNAAADRPPPPFFHSFPLSLSLRSNPSYSALGRRERSLLPPPPTTHSAPELRQTEIAPSARFYIVVRKNGGNWQDLVSPGFRVDRSTF